MNNILNFWERMAMLSFFSFTVAGVITCFTGCRQYNGNANMASADSGSVIPAPVADTTNIKADWEKFEVDANEKIKESNDSIAAFKKRLSKFDRKVMVKYDIALAKIKRENDTLKVRLGNYKVDGNEKLEDFKIHFSHDMEEVKTWLKDSATIARRIE